MLGVLSPQKQAAYEQQLKAKAEKRRARRVAREQAAPPEQDNYFYYIAGYTPGGAPYGITWEEAEAQGWLTDED